MGWLMVVAYIVVVVLIFFLAKKDINKLEGGIPKVKHRMKIKKRERKRK